MADYNDLTINDYASQNKRYDKEGENKWLYKFKGIDAKHALPTIQGLNVYSAYIRSYIDRQKDTLQGNINSNSGVISNHEQRINDLEQDAFSELAKALLDGTKHIYILKNLFSQDYSTELNRDYIKIPIISEYFEGVNDSDCIFKPNGLDITTFNPTNLEAIEPGKFNIDLESMRARFEAYLKYCYKNNGNLTTADRYNALVEWIKGDKAPDATGFTTFFSFPFATFLPSQMKELQEGDLIYDPYSKNLYQVSYSQEDTYVYGLAEYNNNSSQVLNQFWHKNLYSQQRTRKYLYDFYQNIGDWINIDSAEGRFNHIVKNLAYGLIGTEENIDDNKFIFDNNGYINVNTSNSCMKDEHNIKIRNYLDSRILCPFSKGALKVARREDNPYGALFVYCEKVTTLSNNVLWTTTKNEAEVSQYEYQIQYLRQFMSSTFDIKQEFPIIGDYIYNNYSGELVEVTQLPCTSEFYNIKTCLTKPIHKMILGSYNNITCYENTYAKGLNTLIKFDNENLIKNKIYNGSKSYQEIKKLFPNLLVNEAQTKYSDYLITDLGNGIKEVNALYFLQPERFEGINNLFHEHLRIILNMTIKEKDVFVDNGILYQVIKKPYIKNIFRYQNQNPLNNENILNYMQQQGYNNNNETNDLFKYLYYLINCLQGNDSIQTFAQNALTLSYISEDDILNSKYYNLTEEKFNNIFTRYLNSIQNLNSINLPLNYVILIKKIGPILSAHSYYELAVSNGYEGTELEWLDALRGPSGKDGLSAYEIAVNEGFVGTKEDWLLSLKGTSGINGTNGTNGLSAYQIACEIEPGVYENETQWLNSLHGADGSYLYQTNSLKLLTTENENWYKIDEINGVTISDLEVSDQIFASNIYIDNDQQPTKNNCYYYVISKINNEITVKLLYELPSAESISTEQIESVLNSYNITHTLLGETQIESPKIIGGSITGGQLTGGTIYGGNLIINNQIPAGQSTISTGSITVQKDNNVIFKADSNGEVYVKGTIIATNDNVWYAKYSDTSIGDYITLTITPGEGTTFSSYIQNGQKLQITFTSALNISNNKDIYILGAPIAKLIIGQGYETIKEFKTNINQNIIFTYITYNNNNYWIPDYSLSAINSIINGNSIQTGTLTADKIGAGTLASNVIYSGTISADNITSGRLNSNIVYGGTISTQNLVIDSLENDDETLDLPIYILDENNSGLDRNNEFILYATLSLNQSMSNFPDKFLLKIPYSFYNNLNNEEFYKLKISNDGKTFLSDDYNDISNNGIHNKSGFSNWTSQEQNRYYLTEIDQGIIITSDYYLNTFSNTDNLKRGLKLNTGSTGDNYITQGVSMYIQATDNKAISPNNPTGKINNKYNEFMVTERGAKVRNIYIDENNNIKTGGYWISASTMRIDSPKTVVEDLKVRGDITYHGNILSSTSSNITPNSFNATTDFASTLTKFNINNLNQASITNASKTPQQILANFVDKNATEENGQLTYNFGEMAQSNTVMIAYLLNKIKELENQINNGNNTVSS